MSVCGKEKAEDNLGFFLFFFYLSEQPGCDSRLRSCVNVRAFFCLVNGKPVRFANQSSRLYSNISPGWQFNTSQIAASVEKRMALMCPFFIFERLTFATPTFSDNSFKLIFLSAITRSSRNMMCPTVLTSLKCFVPFFLEQNGVPEHSYKAHCHGKCKQNAPLD